MLWLLVDAGRRLRNASSRSLLLHTVNEMSENISSVLLVIAMEAEASPIVEKLGLTKDDASLCVLATIWRLGSSDK